MSPVQIWILALLTKNPHYISVCLYKEVYLLLSLYYNEIIYITNKYRRYGQVVRQWIANPLSPVRIWVSPKIRGYGGMVDTTDLKSVGLLAVRVQVPLPPFTYINQVTALIKE